MKRGAADAGKLFSKRRSIHSDIVKSMKPFFLQTILDAPGICLEKCLAYAIGRDGDVWLVEGLTEGTWQLTILKRNGKTETMATNIPGTIDVIEVHDDVAYVVNSEHCSLHKVDRSGNVSDLDFGCVRCIATCRSGIFVTYEDEEDTIDLRSFEGDILSTWSFQHLNFDRMSSNEDGTALICSFNCSTGASLWKIDLRAWSQERIAGSDYEKGRRDGGFREALFCVLGKPSMIEGSDAILVRDVQPERESRLCHVSLHDGHVTTLEYGRTPETFRLDEMLSPRFWMCRICFPYVYFLSNQILSIDLREDLSNSTFSQDMDTIDWSDSGDVEFKLQGDVIVHADRRILSARSHYFSAMLKCENGMREALGRSIDFTASPINPDVFRIVIAYLTTDEFKLQWGRPIKDMGTDDIFSHVETCLSVVELADQYQIGRLRLLAETCIRNLLLPGRSELVLPLLEKTFESGGIVEQKCWTMFRDRGYWLLRRLGSEKLRGLLERSPKLGATLMMHFAETSKSGKPSPPPGEYWTKYTDNGHTWWYYEGPKGKWMRTSAFDEIEPYESDREGDEDDEGEEKDE